MNSIVTKLDKPVNQKEISQNSQKFIENSKKELSVENLKLIMSLIDLTTLSVTDNEVGVKEMCKKVEAFQYVFPEIPNVAAICVYPSLISVVRSSISKPNLGIASVGAGFPASQTFLEIKIREVQLAVENGANEIDVVLGVGKFLAGKFDEVYNEIVALKNAAGEAKLKVILETGALPDYDAVRKASIIAMAAGADFIKTSTGKIDPAATPEAFLVMVKAISDFYKETGKSIGIKPAGGISTAEDALIYYNIVNKVLGNDWLNSKLFRIGASRLTNNLLDKIHELFGIENPNQSYF